jgi:hypothetical protein
MTNNRTVGVVQVAVGLFWLAVMPVFLWFMVFMEALGPSSALAQPDSAAGRLWRALEILLVEPRWLGTLLSALALGASLIGGILVAVGVGMLWGKAPGQNWGSRTAACGIGFCGLGFLFHWALLMPVVSASQNAEVLRASEDLNLAIPVTLGAGLLSMIGVILVPLVARRQRGTIGNRSTAV